MSSLLSKKLDIYWGNLFFTFRMKVADYIQDKISRLPKRYVFTYEDFIREVQQQFWPLSFTA